MGLLAGRRGWRWLRITGRRDVPDRISVDLARSVPDGFADPYAGHGFAHRGHRASAPFSHHRRTSPAIGFITGL